MTRTTGVVDALRSFAELGPFTVAQFNAAHPRLKRAPQGCQYLEGRGEFVSEVTRGRGYHGTRKVYRKAHEQIVAQIRRGRR